MKINPLSGALYGTPTVNDNTDPNKTDVVTVMVWDKIQQTGNKSSIFAMKNNGTNVIAVGEDGTIIKVNKDGGKAGISLMLLVLKPLLRNDVTFVNSDKQVGYIVGNNGLILKTVDAGSNWSIINTTYRQYNLTSVDFFDVNNGVAVGTNGNILRTTDAGLTWIKSTSYLVTRDLLKVKMLDAEFLFRSW